MSDFQMDVAKALALITGILGLCLWVLSVVAMIFLSVKVGLAIFAVGFGLFLLYIKVDTALMKRPNYWRHERNKNAQ